MSYPGRKLYRRYMVILRCITVAEKYLSKYHGISNPGKKYTTHLYRGSAMINYCGKKYHSKNHDIRHTLVESYTVLYTMVVLRYNTVVEKYPPKAWYCLPW